ncbi:MAG: hypothetical protein AAFY16_14460, partial [Cyanobacteria bacterium J06642_3]
MDKKQYWELPELQNLYFEDSFVLSIKPDSSSVEFLVETVLTENHPHYSLPKPNEQFCYQNFYLTFSDAKEIMWLTKNETFIIGANNEIDYGNIEVVFFLVEHIYIS